MKFSKYKSEKRRRFAIKSGIYFKSTMIDPPFEENNPFVQHYAFLKGDNLEGFDETVKLACSECSWSGLPKKAVKQETEMEEYDFRLVCPECKRGLTTDRNLKKIIRIQAEQK